MHIIGTAGHVDHGKSTLIAALTGTHPDRLKEEQEREMTIELGFGWMTLPNGEEIGIVDVPGHRDFIENMLAGVGGIDAALLVIAADEGVMPQTKEHLAILDLLQIPAGIIVLTKIDLAPDSTWLDLVENDVRAAVANTVMKDAPLVRVSAKNKTGLDQLLSTLSYILETKTTRTDLGRPRLPIDRVFSMSGFGTVVTGTLSDGTLSAGDEIEILPSRLRGRVRGLQTHKKKEERALPGSRTAVNISGINVEQIQRGDVLAHPEQYQATRRLDARFRLLKDLSSSIKHNSEVKFFIGASETIATLRLLDAEELAPGQEAWIQLELREPVVAVRGDRYILRRPSPGETIGGGAVVEPHPKERHKRFDEYVLNSLESLSQGSPADILFEAALTVRAASIKEITTRSRLESEKATTALKELLKNGKLILLEEGQPTIASDLLIMASLHFDSMRDETLKIIEAYHQNFPLRRGIPREELKSRLNLPTREFNVFTTKLINQGSIMVSGTKSLARPGHRTEFNHGQQLKVDELMRKFERSPFAPPSVKECQAEVSEEIFNTLLELEKLIEVSAEVVFQKQDYDSIVMKIKQTIQKNGQITLAEVRDLFKTSRKYAQALLEHLDSINVTVRSGDFRKLK